MFREQSCASSRRRRSGRSSRRWTSEAQIPRALIDACFELGLMGDRDPREARRRGRDLLHVDRSRSRSWPASTPSVAVLVDVQNTLVNNALLRWGTDEQKAQLLPEAGRRSGWAPTRSPRRARARTPSRSPAAPTDKGDHYVLTGRKLWITNAAEAELFIVMATLDPAKGYKGITSFLVERVVPRLLGRQEGGQARHPRLVDLRADPRGLPRAEGERAGRGGQGLQDRDRDAERRPHRHRRADGGRGPGRVRARPRRTRRSAQQFGKPIAEFQAVQFQLAELATQIEAARLLTYNAARLRDAGALPFVKEAAMAKLFASRAAEQRHVEGDRDLRRLRLHPRVPGREVLPRPEGRARSTRAPPTCSCSSSRSSSSASSREPRGSAAGEPTTGAASGTVAGLDRRASRRRWTSETRQRTRLASRARRPPAHASRAVDEDTAATTRDGGLPAAEATDEEKAARKPARTRTDGARDRGPLETAETLRVDAVGCVRRCRRRQPERAVRAHGGGIAPGSRRVQRPSTGAAISTA